MKVKKLVAEARQLDSSLKETLVGLYSKLQNGTLTDTERTQLRRSIEDIKARIAAETKRLGGAPHNEGHAR